MMKEDSILYKIDGSIDIKDIILSVVKEEIDKNLSCKEEFCLPTLRFVEVIVDFIENMRFYALYAFYYDSINNLEDSAKYKGIVDDYQKKLNLHQLKDNNCLSIAFCERAISREFGSLDNYAQEIDSLECVEKVTLEANDCKILVEKSDNLIRGLVNDFINKQKNGKDS